MEIIHTNLSQNILEPTINASAKNQREMQIVKKKRKEENSRN